MHFPSQLRSAVQILNEYRGEQPFAAFLKRYFLHYKKYGSTDRKQISHLCYCYFRLGKSLWNISPDERILTGLFLCSEKPNEMLEQLRPEWNKQVQLSLERKLLIINCSLLISEVFPWQEELSEGVDKEKFCESFFIQPNLFLRMRPGYEDVVREKLKTAKIHFEEISSTCLSLSNASKIDDIIELDTEAVVQDYNSQKIGQIFTDPNLRMVTAKPKVWDCCAGSGGKSLLFHDAYPHIDLTVSDIRNSILINLKKRFAKGGIERYTSFRGDLSQTLQRSVRDFDLIIFDAPCTGSGTWSRTPEQLYFFDEKKIDQYALLQQKIVSNIVRYFKKNGLLVYITCSVFKTENEEIVNFVGGELNLKMVKTEVLRGYDKKADSMFVALFRA